MAASLPASGETRCLAAPPWRPQGRSAPAACKNGAGQTTDIWRQLRNHQKLRIQVIHVETQHDDRCSRGSGRPKTCLMVGCMKSCWNTLLM